MYCFAHTVVLILVVLVRQHPRLESNTLIGTAKQAATNMA